MELKKLIHTLDVLEVVGIDDVKIAGIQSDSRKVEDGFLFVAVRGTNKKPSSTLRESDWIPAIFTSSIPTTSSTDRKSVV